jgi:A/G-specific adenine glycosylase
MDLGATVCARARPACAACPLHAGCIAAREGRQAELPGKKRRRVRPSREAIFLIAQTMSQGSAAVLVERRPSSGLWGGLWSPPQFESEGDALAWCLKEFGSASESQLLPPIDHAFTHFDLRLNPLRVRCETLPTVCDGDDRLWYRLDAPPRIGLPQPIRRLFERLRTTPGRIG